MLTVTFWTAYHREIVDTLQEDMDALLARLERKFIDIVWTTGLGGQRN